MRGDKEAKSPREARRKLLKPQVERRRRQRINSCLEKLRVLLSEAMKNEQKLKNPKMEKAEILEYTVEFLQSKITTPEKSLEDLQSIDYQSGFQQYLQTTLSFIVRNQQLGPSSKDSLFQQLSSTNLCRVTTRVDQSSGPLHRLLHPTSPDNSVDIQSDWHSGQMCRSWRPWL